MTPLNYFPNNCQLNVYGFSSGSLWRISQRLTRYGKPAANENLESMVFLTEFVIADPIAQTDAEIQRNLLREYEQKFEELPEEQKLTNLCSNAGFSKNIEKRQLFITLDDDALDSLKGSRREYTLPQSEATSRARRWIRGNTKIGPVLDVKVCYHQGRYGVEIIVESFFDKTYSFFRSHRERNRQRRHRNVRRNSHVQGNLLRRLDHDRHRLFNVVTRVYSLS